MLGGRSPSPDHPIAIGPAEKKVVVTLGGVTLAESGRALLLKEASLPPVYYLPRDDVAMGALERSATSTHCPYKGDASYFSARDGSARDVAWSYEDPFDAVDAIKDHLAFYPDRVDAITVT
ncbi:Uncharacterized conserved protein, DUF427 family [Sphingomonas guangdongensis]|uniref:Uncharacterized conserved protein, DUF427 family n=1 Tax=Sphingomonas guangdongensis TaxID=1141890 RepID=A0A285QGT8_9SPHN|nr:DUF427 domain-containing protein [Sphingomonas guangdongensis]SOB80728.1 Uncharacterized conserved protein, DUF427 family [Sphingomonas guangdongensis]